MSEADVQRVFEEYVTRQAKTRLVSILYALLVAGITVAALVIIGRRVRSAEDEVQRLAQDRDTLRAQRDTLNSEIEEKSNAVKMLNDQLERRNTELNGVRAAVDERHASPSDALERVRGQLTAGDRKSPAESAEALWSKGYAAYNAGRYDEAKHYYEQARDADSSYAPASNSLGRIAFAENDTITAEKFFREAIAKQPDYVPALNNLARIELRKGNYDGAQRLAREAVRRRPGYGPGEQLLKEIEGRSPGTAAH